MCFTGPCRFTWHPRLQPTSKHICATNPHFPLPTLAAHLSFAPSLSPPRRSTFVTNPVYMTLPSRGGETAAAPLGASDRSRPSSEWLAHVLSASAAAAGQEQGAEGQARLEAVLEAILDAVPSLQTVPLQTLVPMMSDEVVKGLGISYAFEHMEIASYRNLMFAAEAAGDTGTAALCREILPEEQAMAYWLLQHQQALVQQFLAREQAEDTTAKR